jgi:hypothetical protein
MNTHAMIAHSPKRVNRALVPGCIRYGQSRAIKPIEAAAKFRQLSGTCRETASRGQTLNAQYSPLYLMRACRAE